MLKWTIDKFSEVSGQEQILNDMIIDFNSPMELSLRITEGIATSLQSLQALLNDAKKEQKQFSLTMFQRKTPSTPL